MFWDAIGVVVATGAGNLGALAPAVPPTDTTWGRTLAVKLGGVAALVIGSIVQTAMVEALFGAIDGVLVRTGEALAAPDARPGLESDLPLGRPSVGHAPTAEGPAMNRIGEVVRISQGLLVVRSPDDDPPEIGTPVVDETLTDVGRTVDVFGPVERPYVAVSPADGIVLANLLGEKLYAE